MHLLRCSLDIFSSLLKPVFRHDASELGLRSNWENKPLQIVNHSRVCPMGCPMSSEWFLISSLFVQASESSHSTMSRYLFHSNPCTERTVIIVPHTVVKRSRKWS
jgi:hypothetical protein